MKKCLVLVTGAIAMVTLAAPPLGAQQEAPSPAERSRADSVPTLVYSVNRTPESPFQTSRDVTVITKDAIERRDPRTLPDLLLDHGMFVRQSMYSNSRVNLRGFSGKEVLVLVDGVQANNAINNFDLNLIDVRSIERVEIVQGVGSVLGSEALGGILNIITKQGPRIGQSGLAHASVATRVSTSSSRANGEIVGLSERFRYRVAGSYMDTDDFEAGGDIGLMQHTGYVERGGSASADFYATTEQTVTASVRAHQLVDPPRRQRYTSGTYLRWLEPIAQQAATLRFLDVTERRWLNQLQLTLNSTRSQSGRSFTRTSTPNLYSGSSNHDNRSAASLELTSHIGGSHRLLYGVDVATETVHSWGEDTTKTTGSVTWKRGEFTDDATFTSKAAYIQDRMELGKRLVATLGVRAVDYDTKGVESTSAGDYDIGTRNKGVTYSLSTLLRVTGSLHAVGNYVNGFRAPDIEDLSTLTARSSTYEIPSPGLEPANIHTYEGGLKYSARGLSASAFYHVTHAHDVIRSGPGTYRGLSFMDNNGNGVRDAGEPRIEQRVNAGEVQVSGGSATLAYRVTPTLDLSGNYHFATGEDHLAESPVTRMPPAFGTVRAHWKPAMAMKPWMELSLQSAAAQRKLSADDIADAYIGPDGTPGFQVLSARAGATLSFVRVRAAVENITNEAFRLHGSQIDRPGREFVLGAEVAF